MLRVFFLLFSLLLGGALFSSSVGESLSIIPEIEKVNMGLFFDYAIKFDNVSHVLYFNNKPVSLIGISLTEEYYKDITKGWIAFKKYKHLFHHPRFILCEKMRSFHDFYALHIFLINKQAVKKCIHENRKIFEEFLGLDFETEQFLSKLEKGSDLPSLLNDNELLIGILLGFGQEASKLFFERNQNSVEPVALTDDYKIIDGKMIDSLEIYPISFMGNPNSTEAKKIISSYDRELQSIADKFQKCENDSLRFFLQGLCQTNLK